MDKKELQNGVASWVELRKHLMRSLLLAHDFVLAIADPVKESTRAITSGRNNIADVKAVRMRCL